MPLIPTLKRQRLADLCESKDNLVYRAISRAGSKATQNLVSNNTKQNKQKRRITHKTSINVVIEKSEVGKVILLL